MASLISRIRTGAAVLALTALGIVGTAHGQEEDTPEIFNSRSISQIAALIQSKGLTTAWVDELPLPALVGVVTTGGEARPVFLVNMDACEDGAEKLVAQCGLVRITSPDFIESAQDKEGMLAGATLEAINNWNTFKYGPNTLFRFGDDKLFLRNDMFFTGGVTMNAVDFHFYSYLVYFREIRDGFGKDASSGFSASLDGAGDLAGAIATLTQEAAGGAAAFPAGTVKDSISLSDLPQAWQDMLREQMKK